MIAITIAGVTIISLAALSDKEIIYVDDTTVKLVTYVGLGGGTLYLLYQFGKVFMLF